MKLAAAFVAWTVGCALLLGVNLLRHAPADISHLSIHIRDVAILYAIGLAVGVSVVALRFLRRPRPVEGLLGRRGPGGPKTLRAGPVRLTETRLYGPLGRSIAWDAIESIGTVTVNLVTFLEVLGIRQGRHRDGFRVPVGQNVDQIVRLIRYYVDHPAERKEIGTREGAEKAVRLGLLRATLPTRPPSGLVGLDRDPVDPGIRSALELLTRGEAGFTVFTADRERGYYVQAARGRRGDLYMEAAAHPDLAGKGRLNTDAVDRLLSLGWILEPSGSRNFSQSISLDDTHAIDTASRVVRRTLEDVYGLPAERGAEIEAGADVPSRVMNGGSVLWEWFALMALVPLIWEIPRSSLHLPKEQEALAWVFLYPVMVGWGAGLLLSLLFGYAIELLPVVVSFFALTLTLIGAASAALAIVAATPAKTTRRAFAGIGLAILVYAVPIASTIYRVSAL